MSSSPAPARRTSIVAVAIAEVAVIGAVAIVGGGGWLLGMVVGAILGVVATLTVVGHSNEARTAAGEPVAEAQVDPVTGLPTHEKLVADLQEALDAGDDRVLTLYLFSLDGFKDYNSAYGDACGDALLGWLARKLRDAVGSYGNAYRMRGGSFALLAVGSERFTSALCASAASALSENGDGFQIYCDVGQAALPAEAPSPRAALELAARRASQHGSERHVKSGRRAPGDAIEALRLVRSRRDVAAFATGIARRLEVPEAEIETIERAIHLCDVGNVAVPGAVLGYPGKINGPEWQFILLHTLVGERLLAGPLGMDAVARVVRNSHERWDGSGYPDGLAGNAIPLGARIVFVCSAFHDMTSDRPHHAALDPADALAQLKRGAGSQFDPKVVEAFYAEFAGEPVDVAESDPDVATAA
ncbi:MAG TPA: HD domain-containing phosphohydrolase [Solirubrobacteraceae bacterium]|nr:HD domain-containing phosphohydrolase [Solirubrobacteraceae bacterium]